MYVATLILLLLLLLFSTVEAAMCLFCSWKHCTLLVPEGWPVFTTCYDFHSILWCKGGYLTQYETWFAYWVQLIF